MSINETADVVIVGAGFFGLRIAQYACEQLGAERVVVLEREDEVMNRASYVNQARVHNGYHYPRSILTAYRSRISSRAWMDEYAECVVADFVHLYAVASRLSKVTARQFETFCDRIGAELSRPAADSVARHFSTQLIERVWEAEEYAFDARLLRALMLRRLRELPAVEVKTGHAVEQLVPASRGVTAVTSRGITYTAPIVISSVYAGMNELHRRSGMPLIPLQYEIAEMALVRLPSGFERTAVTVMDGPFFSIMPFPSRGLHTLSHVRYTPQERWWDTGPAADDRPIPRISDLSGGRTTFREMIADVRRYVPALGTMEHVDSIREVKVVLANDDRTDSRPILVRADHGLEGYVCVMGGKIDNVNDVLDELSAIATGKTARE